ncbi:MAG: 4-hydroxythreonine-4-phosphate dehydrogenase PdxA [Rhodospirillaceae bacterium]
MPIALTMGEPAGIGGEIALRAWAARTGGVPPFFVIDSAERLETLARELGIACPVAAITSPRETPAVFSHALPVLPLAVKLAAPVVLGAPDPRNSPAVVGAIDLAVQLAQAGKIGGLVTNPINKAVLQETGFAFPGHTEYLGHLAGGKTTVMMLAIEGLRVVPVTVHLALKDVARTLTTARIVACGRILADALRADFGLTAPRLAVAALNPHAGEKGVMGDEETRIIAPAIAELRAQGLEVTGPAPADTMFHAGARARFDAALCMYHDQALIPLKTLDFAGGVNVTLGLPFVRTSPDHGTAFDIAKRGIADPTSVIAALKMAAGMAARRDIPRV